MAGGVLICLFLVFLFIVCQFSIGSENGLSAFGTPTGLSKGLRFGDAINTSVRDAANNAKAQWESSHAGILFFLFSRKDNWHSNGVVCPWRKEICELEISSSPPRAFASGCLNTLCFQGVRCGVNNVEIDAQFGMTLKRFFFGQIPLGHINPLGLLQCDARLHDFRLLFNSFQRPNANDDAPKTQNDEINSWEVCRSKYAAEVGIRIGAGPILLVWGLLLFYIAKGRWRHLCYLGSFAFVCGSLTAICLRTYYDCDKNGDGGNGPHPSSHGSNTVPHKYFLTSPIYWGTVIAIDTEGLSKYLRFAATQKAKGLRMGARYRLKETSHCDCLTCCAGDFRRGSGTSGDHSGV